MIGTSGAKQGLNTPSVKKTVLTGGIITIAVVFLGPPWLVSHPALPRRPLGGVLRGIQVDQYWYKIYQKTSSFIIVQILFPLPCPACHVSFKYTSKYVSALSQLKISNIPSFSFLEKILDTYFVMFSPSYFIRICLYYNIVLFNSFYIRFGPTIGDTCCIKLRPRLVFLV